MNKIFLKISKLKSKKIFLFFLILFLIIFLFIVFKENFNQKIIFNLKQNNENLLQYQKQKILVGNKILIVELADTDFKKAKGLSERFSLDKNEGMLFNFNSSNYYYFWMKNMNFPLDFIWINGNKIVDFTENVSQNYKNFFTAKEKFDKVLEVNAGFIKENNIKIGDEIKLLE